MAAPSGAVVHVSAGMEASTAERQGHRVGIRCCPCDPCRRTPIPRLRHLKATRSAFARGPNGSRCRRPKLARLTDPERGTGTTSTVHVPHGTVEEGRRPGQLEHAAIRTSRGNGEKDGGRSVRRRKPEDHGSWVQVTGRSRQSATYDPGAVRRRRHVAPLSHALAPKICSAVACRRGHHYPIDTRGEAAQRCRRRITRWSYGRRSCRRWSGRLRRCSGRRRLRRRPCPLSDAPVSLKDRVLGIQVPAED